MRSIGQHTRGQAALLHEEEGVINKTGYVVDAAAAAFSFYPAVMQMEYTRSRVLRVLVSSPQPPWSSSTKGSASQARQDEGTNSGHCSCSLW